jgi:hypothetical protein
MCSTGSSQHTVTDVVTQHVHTPVLSACCHPGLHQWILSQVTPTLTTHLCCLRAQIASKAPLWPLVWNIRLKRRHKTLNPSP